MKKQEYAEIEAKIAAAVSDLSDRAGNQAAAGESKTDGVGVREADAGVIKAAEELWEQPVERASEDAWYLDGTGVQQTVRADQKAAAQQAVRPDQKAESAQQMTEKGRTDAGTGRRIPLRRIWSTMAAAAAVLVFVMFYHINLRTDAVVFLDVNPSVSLEINSREKVTQALACNPDGEKILAEMDLRRTDVDVAVNALIGSMIRHGYLSEVQDTLLLSIDCTNAEKKEALRQRLSGEISEELMALLGKSSVFEQDVDVDDDLEDLAEAYGITPGKASLIMKLIEKDPSLDFGKLAGMPMNVLAEYLRSAGIDLRDYTRYLGDDWDDGDDDSDDNDPDDGDDDDPHIRSAGAKQSQSTAGTGGSSRKSSTSSGSGSSGSGAGASSGQSSGSAQKKQSSAAAGDRDDDDDDDRDDENDRDDDIDDDDRDDDDVKTVTQKSTGSSSGTQQKSSSGTQQKSSGGSGTASQKQSSTPAAQKQSTSAPAPKQTQQRDDDDDGDDGGSDDRDDDDDDDDD